MKAAILEQIRRDRADKRPVVLATTLPTGEQRLLYPREPAEGDPPDLVAAARRAADRDRAEIALHEGARIFLQPHNPPLRLVLVGAVHIAQALAPMAALAGFEVIVVDPRTAFATEARFPGVTRSSAWPDEALAEIGLDARTAVVTLTHDPKLDDPALEIALRSDAFYVGSLGSGKTHAARLERLAARGFSADRTARIHGPVGLRIGAISPEEIAISILAQIVEKLRGFGGGARLAGRAPVVDRG